MTSYQVIVDHNQMVEQLILAGKYDWASSQITSRNFPSKQGGKAQIDIFLVFFLLAIESKKAIWEMVEQDLRPAILKELLALGAAYPDLQLESPIVALGSTWRYQDGGLYVPYLGRRGPYRDLHLPRLEGDWPPGWRFAAVRQ